MQHYVEYKLNAEAIASFKSKVLHKQWAFTGSFVTKDWWKTMRSSSLPTLQYNVQYYW